MPSMARVKEKGEVCLVVNLVATADRHIALLASWLDRDAQTENKMKKAPLGTSRGAGKGEKWINTHQSAEASAPSFK